MRKKQKAYSTIKLDINYQEFSAMMTTKVHQLFTEYNTNWYSKQETGYETQCHKKSHLRLSHCCPFSFYRDVPG
jgi:hypothetical protein